MELVILLIFQTEIILNSYSTGIKVWKKNNKTTLFINNLIHFKFYFRDKWLLFDAIVILVSLILVIIDIASDNGTVFSKISSLLRGIFRFLRIFLLIRKVNQSLFQL
jgi:hypothetical protein